MRLVFEQGVFMGVIFSFECKECHYHHVFHLGGGFLTSLTGVVNKLYQCPKCGSLSVREESIAKEKRDGHNEFAVNEEEQRCEKCNSKMTQVHELSEVTCPNCQRKDGKLRQVGWWD